MANPIPKGYHSVTPALLVKNAQKALEFYQKAFGATDVHVMKTPEGKIMHAEFKIGDSTLMLGEEHPAWSEMKSAESLGGSPISLNIYIPDVDAAYKKAVAAGAKAAQKPEDMFWGDRYGKVKDPFGYTWGLLTHKKDMTWEESQKAGAEWLAQMAAGKR